MARLSDAVTTSSIITAATEVATEVATSAASSAVSAAASVSETASSHRAAVHRRFNIAGGLSSEDAMKKVLAQSSLKADDAEGLGEVTTAEAFHKALPLGESVWLTFSNQAYLHFAQNWYLSVRAIGRHRQVVVAALDAPTLKTWRSLRVPVLDYSHMFGDTSDFRGIGSDQARFRKSTLPRRCLARCLAAASPLPRRCLCACRGSQRPSPLLPCRRTAVALPPRDVAASRMPSPLTCSLALAPHTLVTQWVR